MNSSSLQEILYFMVPLGLIFYFLILRPQKKQKTEKILTMKNLKVGDKVIIYSGLHGVVSKVPEDDDSFSMEISDKVVVIVEKEAIFKNISQLDRVAKEQAKIEAEKKAKKNK
ncbi:MAG: preprotein translocase subunit YajC [Fusobacteria bacterium]|nr:MAG: preprotein translocase subunit YajC [Fusobacteriota bacterium]KAF0229824.1 MAG: preprotein translocase subunit [Fusobacteriota bacterium]